jgi:small-conductance mechanosensitive channel
VDSEHWQPWAWIAIAVFGGVGAALLVHALLYHLFDRIAKKSLTEVDDVLVRHTYSPTRLLLPMLACVAVFDSFLSVSVWIVLLRRAAVVGVIYSAAWLVVGLIGAFATVIEDRYQLGASDNLQARRIRTQVELLQRVAVGIVVVIALAAALMSLPSVRQVGYSLFASAGVAGLALGMAARPTLGNMIAGVQIALSQPIRLDDMVAVDNEFGRVEEINATYVVLKLGDERRMVVPLTRFIEQPFINWTRTGSSTLGSVLVYVDYDADVELVRAELRRIVEGTELWDGRVAILQVTDASERAMQLRAQVSAANPGEAFDLRCLVREQLVVFLQRQPTGLPRVRVAIQPEALPTASGGLSVDG